MKLLLASTTSLFLLKARGMCRLKR
uniref:Uncharacterized protein n=1 Tax=Rhizophora mucronata TaxID=61149 RepID=A0A2P2K583_RHIMU